MIGRTRAMVIVMSAGVRRNLGLVRERIRIAHTTTARPKGGKRPASSVGPIVSSGGRGCPSILTMRVIDPPRFGPVDFYNFKVINRASPRTTQDGFSRRQ